MTTPPDQPLAGLLEEAEARFELLRRQDAALGGKEIAEIRAGTEIEIAKLVVNLKNAAQWAAEYGDRLSAALRAQVAEGKCLAEGVRLQSHGWLPNVLCPTDGTWRLHLLPDGTEVVAAFEGADLGPRVRRWRIKTFGYHNPPRPTGESFGGVERFTQSYDTFVVQDMAEGVYPTHFRPNDTVFGEPNPKHVPEPYDDDSALQPEPEKT